VTLLAFYAGLVIGAGIGIGLMCVLQLLRDPRP
jgi:hypothetical protein